MPKITEITVLIAIACFVSMVLELNRFSKNLEKKINKPKISYISSALTSSVCGISTSLLGILFSNNLLVWIILDIIGTFMGMKSLLIILKILSVNLNFLKSSNIIDDAIKALGDETDNSKKE